MRTSMKSNWLNTFPLWGSAFYHIVFLVATLLFTLNISSPSPSKVLPRWRFSNSKSFIPNRLASPFERNSLVMIFCFYLSFSSFAIAPSFRAFCCNFCRSSCHNPCRSPYGNSTTDPAGVTQGQAKSLAEDLAKSTSTATSDGATAPSYADTPAAFCTLISAFSLALAPFSLENLL